MAVIRKIAIKRRGAAVYVTPKGRVAVGLVTITLLEAITVKMAALTKNRTGFEEGTAMPGRW